MNYLQEVFTGRCKVIHIKANTKSEKSSVAHSHSREWKDLAGFRDEMRNNCNQTRSSHTRGALFNFFIPEENASQAKEPHTQRKDNCTGCLSSSLNIYSSNTIKSRLTQNNNHKESHHDQLLFISR